MDYMQEAKKKLKTEWKTPLIVCAIYCLVTQIPHLLTNAFGWYKTYQFSLLGHIYVTNISDSNLILGLLMYGPFLLGLSNYFLKLARDESPTIQDFLPKSKNYIPAVALYFFLYFFISLWASLFFIPGIIAAIKYSQAYYILNDYPGVSPLEAINISKKMMEGRKAEYFILCCKFLGWYILAAILGILIIYFLGSYSYPLNALGFIIADSYMRLTFAYYYEHIKSLNVVVDIPVSTNAMKM